MTSESDMSAPEATAVADTGAANPLLNEDGVVAFEELVGHTHTAAELKADAEPILTVENLRMYFPIKTPLLRRTVGQVQAVDGISFIVPKGGSLGLVGESGCGKSTTGQLITRLYKPTGGSMEFEGFDLAKATNRQVRPLRREIQMIFQDPYSSLNPRHTVGSIVGTPLSVHKVVPRSKILGRVQELLEVVGLNPEHYNRYPNEFSGGQRQRIGIARALALQPKLMVADEPVSALDVSIQAQVINLLQDLQKEFEIAFLFIAHDLAVVRHFCPEVAVMYLGKIVEIGDRESIYSNAHHPYTQALLSAVPDIKQAVTGERRERIRLTGEVPSPIDPPSGCRFRTRCPIAQEICARHEPPLLQIGKRHKVACHFPGRLGEHPREPFTARLLGVDAAGRPTRAPARSLTWSSSPATPTPGSTSTARRSGGPDRPGRPGTQWGRVRRRLFDAPGLGPTPKGGGSLSDSVHAAAPLAVRMRPRDLDELVGQPQLRAPGSPLRQLVEGDQRHVAAAVGAAGHRQDDDRIDPEPADGPALRRGECGLRRREGGARGDRRCPGHPGRLRPRDRPLRRRGAPLQQGPAGRAAAGRREPLGDPGRGNHREPFVQRDLAAAVAEPAAPARVAHRRRHPRGGRPGRLRRARARRPVPCSTTTRGTTSYGSPAATRVAR